MKHFFKKIIGIVLATALLVSAFPFAGITVSAKETVKIGFTASRTEMSVGDTLEIKFSFIDFAETKAAVTAFQLDVYVDPAIFSIVEKECLLDASGALMKTTKYNESDHKLKTVFFSTGKALPEDSTEITRFVLKLEKNFESDQEFEIPVTTALAINADNEKYEVQYASPTVKCVSKTVETQKPSEGSENPGQEETVPPLETIIPAATPETTAGNTEAAKETAGQMYSVKYYLPDGTLIHTENVESGKSATYSVEPYRPGYLFLGWNLDQGTFLSVSCDIKATAYYKKSSVLYTVQVEGGTFRDGTALTKKQFDDCVIVTLDESKIPAGMVFAGWSKTEDNAIVSTSKTYSFLVGGRCTVRAIYNSLAPESAPAIVINPHTFEGTSGIFSAERNVPEGFTYCGSGFIVTEDAKTGADEKGFVLYADGVSLYKASNYSVNAQFYLTHQITEKVIYARAYLVFKNAAGEKTTIYSSAVKFDPNEPI